MIWPAGFTTPTHLPPSYLAYVLKILLSTITAVSHPYMSAIPRRPFVNPLIFHPVARKALHRSKRVPAAASDNHCCLQHPAGLAVVWWRYLLEVSLQRRTLPRQTAALHVEVLPSVGASAGATGPSLVSDSSARITVERLSALHMLNRGACGCGVV